MVTLLFCACRRPGTQEQEGVTMEALSEMKVSDYVVDVDRIRNHITKLGHISKDPLNVNTFVTSYYRNGGEFLWVDMTGVKSQADSLVTRLHRVGECGFSEHAFHLAEIEANIQRLRLLDFDEHHDINRVIAELEYRLTRSYLRLTSGQRFGFINPRLAYLFDEEKVDTAGTKSTRKTLLFDTPIERPSLSFYTRALRMAKNDSIGVLMDEVESRDPFYQELKRRLGSASRSERKLLMINMERCRWRVTHDIPTTGKRVVVNIPAFELYAYDDAGLSLSMRIGCGTPKTRTPILSSRLEYFQVNPEWTIPKSIVIKDVARHAGDSAYFARHRYYIAERATGHKKNVWEVSRSMLLSGNYRVTQEGGPGNSMGRIVFRFKNNYSVYLHDTSTPGFFQNARRCVSHGCVRVQKPFELAQFLLGDADEWTLDKIRISMDLPPETDKGRNYLRQNPRPEDEVYRLTHYNAISPSVPVHIIYYTYYPDAEGELRQYPDVYDYDAGVWEQLQPLL